MSVRASHLLIKHQGSRNPVSSRTGQSTASTTREAANTELLDWLGKIKGGEITFADAATARSDCDSFQNGGDLGVHVFGPGAMRNDFDNQICALAVGEVSDIVETDIGSHIILRTA